MLRTDAIRPLSNLDAETYEWIQLNHLDTVGEDEEVNDVRVVWDEILN
jgi:hypothetical protein